MVYPILAFAAFLISFGAGLVVLSRRPKANLNQVFSFLLLLIALWNLCIAAHSIEGLDKIVFEYFLDDVAVVLVAATWLYFAERFVGKETLSVWYYLPAIFLIPLLLFTNLVYTGWEKVWYGYRNVYALLGYIEIIYIQIFILYGLYEVINAYRKASGADKERIKWVVLGFSSVIAAGTLDIILIFLGIIFPTISNIVAIAISYYVVYLPYTATALKVR